MDPVTPEILSKKTSRITGGEVMNKVFIPEDNSSNAQAALTHAVRS